MTCNPKLIKENKLSLIAQASVANNPISSGGYWVRRMRQLPRPPLENSTYSFNSLQMFFRGYYEVGTKTFFFSSEITMIFGEKSERRDQSSFSFLENINF